MNIFRYFVEITIFNHLKFFSQLIHSYFTANIWFFSHVHVWFRITCVKDRMDVSCNILFFLLYSDDLSVGKIFNPIHIHPRAHVIRRIMQLIEIQIPVQRHGPLFMNLSFMLCFG